MCEHIWAYNRKLQMVTRALYILVDMGDSSNCCQANKGDQRGTLSILILHLLLFAVAVIRWSLRGTISVGDITWLETFIKSAWSGVEWLPKQAVCFVSTLHFIFTFDRPALATPSLTLCKPVQMSHSGLNLSPFSPWKTFKPISCYAPKTITLTLSL